jgi:20S proteasome subunit alpha 6
LRECLPQEKELNVQNTTVAVVGRGDKFGIFDDENVAGWLELLGGEVGSTRARQAKERENAEKAAGSEDPSVTGGDAMQTD